MWAGSGAAGEDIDGDDLAEAGVAPEEIEKLRALYGNQQEGRDADQDAAALFGIFPENWDAVRVFCALETQWREAASWTGYRVRTGLDYAAIGPVMKGLAIRKKHRPAVFADLRTMERAALKEMARETAR